MTTETIKTTTETETHTVAVTVSICPYEDLTNFGFRLGVFAVKHPRCRFGFQTDDIYLDDDGDEVDEDDEDFDADDYEKDRDYVRVVITLKTQADHDFFVANFAGID